MNNDYEIILEATKGLLYISETDHPFEVAEVSPGASTEATVREMCGRQKELSIEKISLDYFFRNMIKADADGPQEEQQNAKRFQQLQQLLKEKLRGVEVYRLGTTTIDAVIVGTLQNANLLTLKTKLVET